MTVKKSIILTAVMALIMTACNDVPEDVKLRTEGRESVIEAAQNRAHTGEIRYIPLSQMQADIDVALKDKYSNLTLRDGIEVALPDKLTECEFVQISDFLTNYDNVSAAMLDPSESADEDILSMPMIQSDKLPNGAPVNIKGFRDEDKQIHFINWENGFICLIRPAMFENGTVQGNTVKTYRLSWGEGLSDKYLIGSREYTMQEAFDEAQKWVDEKYAQFEPDYKLTVNFAKVLKDDLGQYSIFFNVMKTYNNVKLENHYMTSSDEESGERSKIISCHKKVIIGMKSGNGIDYLSNNDGMVKPVEQKTLDKGVSLSSALEYIEKQFTDFNEPLTITDIQLKYALFPEYDQYKTTYQYPGNTLKSRLVWEFEIAVPEDELRNVYRTYGDVCKYITIDVETGEMGHCFETSMVLQE